jgi:hypothetical protein
MIIGAVGPEFYTVENLERWARTAISEIDASLRNPGVPEDPLISKEIIGKLEAAQESMYIVLAVAEGLPNTEDKS